MENKTDIIARVKSPARGGHLRTGNGFSREEIKSAGKDIHQLRTLNINIDYFRKSVHSENIEKLKKLKILKIPDKVTKKKPFVKKEKKTTPFKPRKEKSLQQPSKIQEKTTKIPLSKEKPKSKRKEKVKPIEAKKIKAEVEGTPLTELGGLGAAIAKKFSDLGVSTIEELCKENPEELAALVKGVSVVRINKWIEEGKELIKN